ncbi:MAG TPA: 5-formyltetrahydrofolate cyclo-ligase [Kineosporiaceae bacterium]|nr:5-formyltetrahydrofolate cyclo-ligase [Kineosporiaceae bacterium]
MPASQAQLIPTKLALRRTLKAQRHGRTAAERDQVARAIAAVGLELPRLRQADCVAVYASLPEEPGTALLRAGLRELGIRVLLPVVGDDPESRRLDWAQDQGELVSAGALNLLEPPGERFGPAELGKAQVILVPALAVDTTGTRLGRGGGYYDTALTQADPHALRLALVHDQEVLDAETTPIPREPHDVEVHGAITPTRWMFFRSVQD